MFLGTSADSQVTESGVMVGCGQRVYGSGPVGLDRAGGQQKRRSVGTAEAYLFGLAHDYDRWGLAPEAEVTRYRARQATINRLLIDAKAGRLERDAAGPHS